MSTASPFILMLIVVVLLPIYFLPSILAVEFRRHNSAAIFVANLLFGWTFLGWGICLVWAFMKPAPQPDSAGAPRFLTRQGWAFMSVQPMQKRNPIPDEASENLAFQFLMDTDDRDR